MLDSVFRLLFKYERPVFEQGRFVLGATRSMWIVAAIAAAALIYAVWTYWQVAALGARDRAVLFAFRTGLLLVAIFATLQPMLQLKVAVPQQNFVGVLLDDSRSMQIPDEGGRPRSQFVTSQFGGPDAPLLSALSRRFVPRVFRFSSAAERLRTSGELTFQGTATRLGEAIDRARDQMSGLPVAGLVVVTDGADNAETTIDQTIAGLKSEGLPVFTVGVGRDRLTRDVQVTRAETPRRALQGASLVVDVVVTQTGYAGLKVPLVVESEGRLVSTQDITLPANGESSTIKVRFKTADAGAHVFRFRVPVQNGEDVGENNQRDALIDVDNGRRKILYFEGEPRPELKFIREATTPDQHLQVVTLVRMAEATANSPAKLWRGGLDPDHTEELQAGFPQTREELFSYQGIILGSVEAGAFTPEQQRLLEDFVDIRGGGLLALGGDRAFGEGGWGGTPLADALPIAIPASSKGPIYPPLELVVKPTRAGESHPATQITDRAEDAAAKWRDLPSLTAVNAVPESALKPGATELLSGTDGRGHNEVVLAFQRYGRGKTLVLPVQDTWLWRMDAKMAADDHTHANFWQRLARWLVDGVPDRVMIATAPDRVQAGEPVTLTATVRDAEFAGVNDGRITAHVTGPSGAVEDVPLVWNVEGDGEYFGRFTPSGDGLYQVAVDGTDHAGADVGRGTTVVRVAPSDAEYFDAAMRAPLLERLATETGGRFFRAADTSTLPDAIAYSGKGVTVSETRDLWDMPIILLLLLGLMGGEWIYRRSAGLV